jgi:opacity protein-like surface antigen
MTKCLLGMTALVAMMLASTAQAADMPLKARPYAAPVVNDWTGFYVGVHGGYGWGKLGFDSLEATELPHNSDDVGVVSQSKPKGAVFGAHAGYNWQRGMWVGGIEIDYSGADLKESQSRKFTLPFEEPDFTGTLSSKINQLASARARVGFLITPDLLFYGTGGAAWAHTNVTSTSDTRCSPDPCSHFNTFIDRSNTNHFGWVVGAGGEWRLFGGGNWSLRVEYLHYDFGRTTHTFSELHLFANGNDIHDPNAVNGTLRTDVVRGGLSYKF